MSFEVYVQRFVGGKTAAFSRDCINAIFGPHMSRPHGSDDVIELTYRTGDGGILYLGNDAEISSVMISRPGTEELFDDLFKLIDSVGAVLYWPGEKPCLVVATHEITAELPESILEALGPGILVRSGCDIIAAIKRKL